MRVELTSDVEARRINDKKPTWGLFSSTSLVAAVHKAKELGWKDKKVQVRLEPPIDGIFSYVVEPYERDCNCPNMLKYSDFFD
jgi:hypothetical protein